MQRTPNINYIISNRNKEIGANKAISSESLLQNYPFKHIFTRANFCELLLNLFHVLGILVFIECDIFFLSFTFLKCFHFKTYIAMEY